MSTVQELRARGETLLRDRWAAAGPPPGHSDRDPKRDADVLLASLLSLPSAELILHRERELSPALIAEYDARLERRSSFEPVAYIIGSREFWGLNLKVSPAVLIPRPETELVVERAVQIVEPALREGGSYTVADVGTGSGAILLAIVNELRSRLGNEGVGRLRAIGIDISTDALTVAAENAQQLGLQDIVSFVRGHLLEPIQSTAPLLIVSNPPYVEEAAPLAPELGFEPRLALFGGADGLQVITELVDDIERRLSQGQAAALIEIGACQDDALHSLLRLKSGLDWSFHRDLGGIPRVIEIRPGYSGTKDAVVCP